MWVKTLRRLEYCRAGLQRDNTSCHFFSPVPLLSRSFPIKFLVFSPLFQLPFNIHVMCLSFASRESATVKIAAAMFVHQTHWSECMLSVCFCKWYTSLSQYLCVGDFFSAVSMHLVWFLSLLSLFLFLSNRNWKQHLSYLGEKAKYSFSAEPGEILPQSYSWGTLWRQSPCAQWKRGSPCWSMRTLSGYLCPLAQTVMYEHLILVWIMLLPALSPFFLLRVKMWMDRQGDRTLYGCY